MSRPSEPIADHARLIGEIVVEWSVVTRFLEELFAQLAGLDDPYVRAIFRRKITDAQLDEMCSALAARLDQHGRDALREWLRLVSEARKQSNDYLHGAYASFQLEEEWHLQLQGRDHLDRHAGTAEWVMTTLTVRDLESFRDLLQELQRKFEQLPEGVYPFPRP